MSDIKSDYEVGYGKPPKETRFKPGGPSPNPKGRPKGSRNPLQILTKILGEKITVHENGKMRRISRLETIFHTITLKAMKGDPKAFNNMIALLRMSGMITPDVKDDRPQGGVLLVEAPMSIEMWELAAEKMRQQQMRDEPDLLAPPKSK